MDGARCRLLHELPGQPLTGGPLTAGNLASAVFNGTATAGNDTVSLSDGALAAAVSNPDSVLGLSAQWNTA